MRFPAVLIAAAAALGSISAAAQNRPDHTAAEADRRVMLDRLGIASTRQGADGFDSDAPNAANYDESRAAPASPLPELMRLADGTAAITPEQWRTRRAEIVELFDREV